MSALLGLINFIFMKNYITAEVTDQSQIAEEWNQLKKIKRWRKKPRKQG
jgi:hypothetical protein